MDRCCSSASRLPLSWRFVLIERRSPDPVLRLEFFRIPTFSAANAVAFATSFGLFAVFFFTALYLQVVSKFSGWKIALQFVAMAVAMVVAGLIAGRWTAARGPAGADDRRLPALGRRDLRRRRAARSRTSSVGALAAALALVGFGLGLALVAVTTAVLSIVPAERSGMAASTLNTSRQLGGVLAVAILGAVINARLVSELTSKLTAIGVPGIFQGVIVHAVTDGGLPANAAQAAASNPVAAAAAAANPGCSTRSSTPRPRRSATGSTSRS